jgi:hypothetical protein
MHIYAFHEFLLAEILKRVSEGQERTFIVFVREDTI